MDNNMSIKVTVCRGCDDKIRKLDIGNSYEAEYDNNYSSQPYDCALCGKAIIPHSEAEKIFKEHEMKGTSLRRFPIDESEETTLFISVEKSMIYLLSREVTRIEDDN